MAKSLHRFQYCSYSGTADEKLLRHKESVFIVYNLDNLLQSRGRELSLVLAQVQMNYK